MQLINGIKGMPDVLPDTSGIALTLERKLRDIVSSYGYQCIKTPILESTRLFTTGLGAITDVVEKEMYSFTDALNGESLTLRPENTAGVIRSCIENNLTYDGGKRLYYFGEMFRHEKPQRGRFRQFRQFGVEAVGFAGSEVDVEVILMAKRIFDFFDVDRLNLEINSIGDQGERQLYKESLVQYLSKYSNDLDADSQRRLNTNPLRILDSKKPIVKEIVSDAPKISSFLGVDSKRHFDSIEVFLQNLGVKYEVNHHLVRGLDYYNRTVFEFTTTDLGAQSTICAGGRYDALMERLGGKSTPAVGWAIGFERLYDLLSEQHALPEKGVVDFYVAVSVESAFNLAFKCAERLREKNLTVIVQPKVDERIISLKSQMKRADNSGARFVIIIGENELSQNGLSIKSLRDEGAEQKFVNFIDLDSWVSKFVGEKNEKL